MAVAVIGSSVLLTPSTEALTLFGVEIPPLCTWKRLTGHDCLGCGLTRSFTFMGHGRWSEAFELHRLGPLLWVGTLTQIPWRIFALLRLARGEAPMGAHAGPGPGRG